MPALAANFPTAKVAMNANLAAILSLKRGVKPCRAFGYA
ncbi:hypothetical protein LTSEALA_1273 [Salmonella enterica subsp. enterica serovar Alachua str. R6-377]|uniref:Uncharacterized protein n=1 Tax=Salmonella enterica subsp. enterica serovar Alachua str. R6-377 TaxID=913241 RepID=G5LLD6_SALET|nr:hypothetical protein LTSEALA_1273 [Salmonella enterica subsp. enterica serovar Alachua str. R6-377]